MNHRFAVWALVAALLTPAAAGAQTVVRLLHIEEDRAKVALRAGGGPGGGQHHPAGSRPLSARRMATATANRGTAMSKPFPKG
ncbi:MAG: hypothetical protein M3Z21_09600, partial [Pseudomonadota bacterium]|nr:hypothetical protein [Pseudomonadota bacterium]